MFCYTESEVLFSHWRLALFFGKGFGKAGKTGVGTYWDGDTWSYVYLQMT